MTGFSSTWLAAREPWDHAARAPAVTDAALAWLAARRTDAPLRIIDLGCGAGSNLAFLAPRIAGAQHWTLVDDDPALLAEAAGRAARLAGVTTTPRGADLAAGDLAALLDGADLVTCAALLDLVSEAWVGRLLDAVAATGAALLSVITYDGRAWLEPAGEGDAMVLELFNAHQRRDKGFGPALGPESPACLARLAAERGHRMVSGRSDWLIDPRDGPGAAMLLDGWAGAAAELRPGSSAEISAWRRGLDRRPLGRVVVGHEDAFVAG